MELFENINAVGVMTLLGVALFAVLFLQSGIDKVLDWKGNMSWLTGHFEKTFLAGTVPVLLGIVTVLELIAGGACAYGVVEMVIYNASGFAEIGLVLSGTNLLMLFAGQRIAKDYPGAAVLASYFLFALVLLFFLG